MITTLLFDFSRVILFPKDPTYPDELNKLHQQLSNSPEYSFLDHFQLDTELLEYLESIKVKVKLYIFTSGNIQNAPEIKPRLDAIFRQIFSAAEIGFTKKEPPAFTEVARRINTKPEEILFIDDSSANIAAVQTAGLRAVLYTSLDQIRREIDEIITRR